MRNQIKAIYGVVKGIECHFIVHQQYLHQACSEQRALIALHNLHHRSRKLAKMATPDLSHFQALRREIRTLKQENAELQVENARIRSAYRSPLATTTTNFQSRLPLAVRQPVVPQVVQTAPAARSGEPPRHEGRRSLLNTNYLSPTIASSARASNRDEPDHSEDQSEDQTAAPADRDPSSVSWSEAAGPEADQTEEQEAPNVWAEDYVPVEPRTADENDNVSREADEVSDDAVDADETEELERAKPLKDRTRLHEEWFYSTPAGQCPVAFPESMQIMENALGMAQESWWNVLHDHFPRAQRRHYLEGPDQVEFGGNRLEDWWCSVSGLINTSNENYRKCQRLLGGGIGGASMVRHLRNAVCHPAYHDTREIDSDMRYAQSLAVSTENEAQAYGIRRLRDALQVLATDSYEEIEQWAYDSALPGAELPSLHVQHFLDQWSHAHIQSQPWTDAMKQAREAWKSLNIEPGAG